MPKCRTYGGPPKRPAHPDLGRLTEEIQQQHGIILSYKDVGALLHMTSHTAINRWIRANAIQSAGRPGYYYSRDVARAILDPAEAS